MADAKYAIKYGMPDHAEKPAPPIDYLITFSDSIVLYVNRLL